MSVVRSVPSLSARLELRQLVVALFTVTGFSALCLQVVWQRVISIHGSVDPFSAATAVATFMAGLGNLCTGHGG